MFDWPYYTLIDGILYAESSRGMLEPFGYAAPRFADAAEAETWLVANDIRGSVRVDRAMNARGKLKVLS